MDYREKYEQALEKARELMNKGYDVLMPEIFPELQESEDEKIRKEIIRIFKGETRYTSKEDTDKYVTWLEKQEEKQPVNFTDIDIKTWKYVVDAVLTEENGIGQYLDSAHTEEIAKKLQKRFSDFKKQDESDKEKECHFT